MEKSLIRIGFFLFQRNKFLSYSEEKSYKALNKLRHFFVSRGDFLNLEEVYKQELEVYKKITTSKTDKAILFLSNLFHGHRTNIFKPIIILIFIFVALIYISFVTEKNLLQLLYPGGFINLFQQLETSCFSSECLIFSTSALLVLQIIILYMYYEIVLIARKFVRKR